MTVLWTEDAIESLGQLAAYIERFSEAAASRMLIRIADRLDLADESPRQGRMVPEFEDDAVREVIVQRYRIWYWIRGEDIEVLAVFHGSRYTRS